MLVLGLALGFILGRQNGADSRRVPAPAVISPANTPRPINPDDLAGPKAVGPTFEQMRQSYQAAEDKWKTENIYSYVFFPQTDSEKQSHQQEVFRALSESLGLSTHWMGDFSTTENGKQIQFSFTAHLYDIKNRDNPRPLTTVKSATDLCWGIWLHWQVDGKSGDYSFSSCGGEYVGRKDDAFYFPFDASPVAGLSESISYMLLPVPGRLNPLRYFASGNGGWRSANFIWRSVTPAEEEAERKRLARAK